MMLSTASAATEWSPGSFGSFIDAAREASYHPTCSCETGPQNGGFAVRRNLARVLPLLLVASGTSGRVCAEEGAADKGELVTFRGVAIPAHGRAAILRTEHERLEAIREGSVVQRWDPTVGPTEPHPIDLGVSTFIVDDFEQGFRWEPITWAGQPETEVVTPAEAAAGQVLKLKCEPHGTEKSGIGLRMSIDTSSFDRLLFDCHLAEVQSCNLAIAFWTGKANEFFETPWMPLAQGWNRDLAVHLRSGTFKCAASGWQHTSSLSNHRRSGRSLCSCTTGTGQA